MSDQAMSSVLTAVVLGGLAVWVPLLETFAWLHRREPAASHTPLHARENQPKRESGGPVRVRA